MENRTTFVEYYQMVFSKIMFFGPLRWFIFLGVIALLLERLGVSRTIMASLVAGYSICFLLGVWKGWYKEENKK